MKKVIYTLVITMLLLVSGCIKENFDECKVMVKLLFSYFGDGAEEIFLDKNQKVNLYVYNEVGELVYKKEIYYRDLQQLQGTYLNLPSGDYTVICWGNLYGNTAVQESSYPNSTIGHLLKEDNSDYSLPIDSIYYGSYQLNIPSTHKLVKDTLVTDVVKFRGAHIKFEIAVRECKEVSKNEDLSKKYYIIVDQLPDAKDFDKKTKPEICKYQLTLDKNIGSTYYTEFNSLRFPNDNSIKIKLMSVADNSTLYEVSLKEFLQEKKIDVEKYNEVKIPILIELCGSGGTIDLVNGIYVDKWVGVDLEPIID